MSYGVIEYDKKGLPICEICNKSFSRIGPHVYNKHGMFAREYKNKFGFDVLKGICSKQSSQLSRTRVFENYDLCIGTNLLSSGESTRFLKGSKGRTRDMVSQQSLIRLKKQFKDL